MESHNYIVEMDGIIVAEGMQVQHALIFAKALFFEYYNEPGLKITIAREPTFEEMYTPYKNKENNNGNSFSRSADAVLER